MYVDVVFRGGSGTLVDQLIMPRRALASWPCSSLDMNEQITLFRASPVSKMRQINVLRRGTEMCS